MKNWKKNLWILCAGQFLFMASMSQIIPFLPLYLQELGLTDSAEISKWSGLIFGSQFLTALIFSPIWGKIADRYGRKMMLIRSGIGMAIVTILMGFATNHIHLLILRIINGTISGFIPAAIALTATNTPKERTGYAIGILQSSAVAGSICGPLIGGVMADIMGFRAIFMYTGIFVFLATLIVIFFVHEKFERKENEEKTSLVQDFKVIIARKPILSFFFIGTLIQLAMLGTMPLIPLFVQELTDSSQYLAFLAGLTGAVMGFTNMLASPQLGKLGDRHGAQHVLFYSLIAAALITLPQAFVLDLWQLIALRFLLGVTLGGMLPSLHTLVRHYAPKGMESRTYSYATSATFLGNFIGPIAAGQLAAQFGLRSIFISAFILLLLSACWVKYLLNVHFQQQAKEQIH
ncbi:MFS transporter [Bacillus horti]|uniref:DHA1 family multidrug resistance protein-like MFS transporter n=1 Tax=Caldalkalibacillus horti TaxID=77523 RepID=A0ABT9W2V2_9BACI|nr:MFS transporter [Bacillus horti]MDQ0167450.1 DHA1 family multidrug resistance protein-like MFS transporter [Bacillus horti]